MTQTIDHEPVPGKQVHWSKRARVHFEDDQILELLQRLEEGESLSSICRDPRMPAYSTVYSWLEDGTGPDGFDGQFRGARARGLDKIADDCIDISDENASDAVDVARNRLRVDTRLRLLGKWNRSKYGEGVDITTGGEKLTSMDDEAASRRMQEILERARMRAAQDKGE